MKKWRGHILKGFLGTLGGYICLILIGRIEGVAWNKAIKIIDVKVSILWLIGIMIISSLVIIKLMGNNFEIIEAYYGIDNDENDQNVTDEVRKKVQNNKLKMLASHRTLGIDDPMVDVPKRMKIKYRSGLLVKTKVYSENDPISIP